MQENHNFLRLLNDRCHDRYKEGQDCLCEASVGALLIAKHDLPQWKAKQGDMFVCCRSYTPQCGRGRVNILTASDRDIMKFINKAWYRRG